MSGLVLKARTLAELIDSERAPSDDPKRHLPALHDVFLLCLDCPLADCDQDNPGCLLKVESKSDKRLRDAIRYQLWLEGNFDRRSQKQRANYVQKKTQRAASKSTPASRGATTPRAKAAGVGGTGRPAARRRGRATKGEARG